MWTSGKGNRTELGLLSEVRKGDKEVGGLSKDKTVASMMLEIVEDMCSNYCKWPHEWDEEEKGMELCESEICANCPLGRLGV